MKKTAYYILMCLALACASCQEETLSYGPRAEVSYDTDVYVDPRDGKTYRTITIDGLTWMVDNFAFRLDSGSWAGCYTYDEITPKAFTEAEIEDLYAAIPRPGPDLADLSFEDFWNEVEAAGSDGRLSNDTDQWGFMTPYIVVTYIKQYVDMGALEPTVDAFMNDPVLGLRAFLAYYDADMQQAVLPVVEAIINKLAGNDPFEIFKSLLDEAKADGRIGSQGLPEFEFMTPALIVDMTLPTVSSIDEFMNVIREYYLPYYASLQESLMPVLEQLVVEVTDRLGGDEWPTPELKAAALADAVKTVQTDAFELAETINGHYSDTFGLLYTLDAARRAVPEGWRIPTDEDWKKLERALGMPDAELGRLETWRGGSYISEWFKSPESGFNLRYAGTRAYHSLNGYSMGKVFMNKDMKAYYLADCEIQQNDSTYFNLVRIVSLLNDGVMRATMHPTSAHSLRLVRDASAPRPDDEPSQPEAGGQPGEATKE